MRPDMQADRMIWRALLARTDGGQMALERT